MVDSIGKNINIKLKGQNTQLNKNTIKGTTIDKDTPIFMKKYDKNNDGVISQKESEAMLKDLKKAAHDDTLSEKEFTKAKLGTKEDYKKIGSSLSKTSGTQTVKNENGSTTTTVRNEDGTITKTTVDGKKKVVQNYDANGNITSQQSVTPKGTTTSAYKYDENGNLLSRDTVNKNSKNQITGQNRSVYTYDEAGNRIGSKQVKCDAKGNVLKTINQKIENNADGDPIKISTVSTDKNGKVYYNAVQENQYNNGTLTASTIKETDKDNTITTNKNYAEDGKTVLSLTQDVVSKNGNIAHTEQKHNANGKLAEKHTVQKDASGNITSDLTTKMEYAKDGKTPSKMTVTGSKAGNPHSENIQYDEKGELKSIDKTFYNRGQKIEEHYEGPNLNNRSSHLPSKQIAYEADGKTIKEITINKFDKDGVLIGSEVQDKDGKVIDTHDFSKIDGKFDTSYQKGRGDCYLLAGLNALRESEGGRDALKDTITTGKDPKTGETTYTVHFPGAAKVRENLIKQGVPEDQIDIKDSYTYTESEIHEKAKLAGPKYSAGDKDVLLLEVAYEDMRTDAQADIKDLHNVNPKLSQKELQKELHISGTNEYGEDDYLSGGQAVDAIYMLTGKESDLYLSKGTGKNTDNAPVCSIDSDLNMTVSGEGFKLSPEDNAKIDDMFNKIEQDCKDGKLDNYAGTLSFNVSLQTVNGKAIPGGGHAFTISRVDGDKVYLRNPWDPTKEIVMTKDEVKKSATKIALTDMTDGSSNNTTTVGGSDNGGGSSAVGGTNGENSGQVNTNLQAGSSFSVPKGQRYSQLIKDALVAQGIDPTPENIKKASEQFQVANKGAVKIYNGSRSEWKGNKYLIAGMSVKIPKFEM